MYNKLLQKLKMIQPMLPQAQPSSCPPLHQLYGDEWLHTTYFGGLARKKRLDGMTAPTGENAGSAGLYHSSSQIDLVVSSANPTLIFVVRDPEALKDMEVTMVEDWLANAYEGMSGRQFVTRMTAAGIGLAGYAAASSFVAGEIIATLAGGLVAVDSKVSSGGFSVPVYEAHPSAPGKYPIVLVIPEVFGMHEHIKDVVRRFAKAGYFAITFEPYAKDALGRCVEWFNKYLEG
jgi:hypothetical protein